MQQLAQSSQMRTRDRSSDGMEEGLEEGERVGEESAVEGRGGGRGHTRLLDGGDLCKGGRGKVSEGERGGEGKRKDEREGQWSL